MHQLVGWSAGAATYSPCTYHSFTSERRSLTVLGYKNHNRVYVSPTVMVLNHCPCYDRRIPLVSRQIDPTCGPTLLNPIMSRWTDHIYRSHARPFLLTPRCRKVKCLPTREASVQKRANRLMPGDNTISSIPHPIEQARFAIAVLEMGLRSHGA